MQTSYFSPGAVPLDPPPMNSTPPDTIESSPVLSARIPGPPRSRRSSRPTLSPAAPKRPGQRLRLAQLEDVSYPVNYPVHPVPEGIPADSIPPPSPEDIATRKYATSVDDRNYLTVYEYQVNGQSVIWDYYTGYVHLTGIWKAIGNSKADIAKMLDVSPQLDAVLRRVRGGFLKIQGTWLPYHIARDLSLRIAYHIRFALVPLFGPSFPQQCLLPIDPRFGQLTLNEPSRALGMSLPPNMMTTANLPSVSSIPSMTSMSTSSMSSLHSSPPHDHRGSISGPPSPPPGRYMRVDPIRRMSETDLRRRRHSLSQAIRRGRTSSAPYHSKPALTLLHLRGTPVEWAVDSSDEDEDSSLPGAGDLEEMLRATHLLQQLSMSAWPKPAYPLTQAPLEWRP